MENETDRNRESRGLRNHRFFGLFAFAFAVLLFLSGMTEAEGQGSQKASSALLAKVQKAGSVRVIVRLNTSFQPEGQLSGPTAVASQKTRIASLQGRLQQEVSRHNVRGIKKFKHIPYTAMAVDPDALDALIANPLVVSVAEDKLVPATLTESVPLIKANQAWGLGYTGSGWTVAVLDSGVDKTHSFFPVGKVGAEACYSTTDVGEHSETVCPNSLSSQTGAGAGIQCGGANGTDIDGCRHGTHVAGIAAGKSATINGVAKEANIIAIQVFSKITDTASCSSSGLASPCALSFTSDQIQALEYVYSLRNTYSIAAVNISIGGGQYFSSCDLSESAIKAVIDNLRSAGIATVISSGNESYKNSVSAPACVSSAVSVGATTKAGAEADYSNYHPTMLSLFAPGSAINSSVPGGGWDIWDGTSMAAPHVAGAWAIVKQKWPTASVANILKGFQDKGVAVALKAGDLTGGSVKRIDVLAVLGVNLALNMPTGLSGSSSSTSGIDLTWTDNSANETGFKIDRKTGAGGTYSEIATVGAGTVTYPDTGLSEGKTYYYRVSAYNAEGDSPESDEAFTVTILGAPSGLTASAVSNSQINLTWTDNSGAESEFLISREGVSGGPYTEIGTADSNATSYNDTGLTFGTTYFYRVQAVNDETASAYSNEATATCGIISPLGGSGGGACFIATAAFGTPWEKHVRILRSFRDRCLLTTSAGRTFVKFYYEVSPPVAARISQNEGLRFFTRCVLMPLVVLAYGMVNYGATTVFLFTLSVILFAGAFIRLVRRKMSAVKC
jgi:subtilisin family serine protease